MPSFDIVSEVDKHEVSNAVDQARREIGTRFDFKGSDAAFDVSDEAIKLTVSSDFQLQQMLDILISKLTKRGIAVGSLEIGEVQVSLKEAKQNVTPIQGIESSLAKKIVALVKKSNIKVQAAIQGHQVRITGKKRDDLQAVMDLLRAQPTITLPLQFTNFRD